MLFIYLNLFHACDEHQTFSLYTYFFSIPVRIYIKFNFFIIVALNGPIYPINMMVTVC